MLPLITEGQGIKIFTLRDYNVVYQDWNAED